MKANKMMMAVVAVFMSLTVMTAQVPAKKDVKAEPAKKECCQKAKACKDAKTAECKGQKNAAAHEKSACCKDKKVAAQTNTKK
ncbi:MAG: hypothetical protein ACYC2P_03160 [Paludibacteraceae bacterium]